jgi:hypothetical protein
MTPEEIRAKVQQRVSVMREHIAAHKAKLAEKKKKK